LHHVSLKLRGQVLPGVASGVWLRLILGDASQFGEGFWREQVAEFFPEKRSRTFSESALNLAQTNLCRVPVSCTKRKPNAIALARTPLRTFTQTALKPISDPALFHAQRHLITLIRVLARLKKTKSEIYQEKRR